jgi:GNAT superfamily N-acetyltransferase
MVIRPLEIDDLPAVADLARSLAAHVGDPDPGTEIEELQQAALDKNPWCECLVAIDNETVVGFAMYCRRYEAHTRQRSLWLGDLAVLPEVRRRGFGRALIKAVRARARVLDCVGVTVDLWRENEGAMAFYDFLGAGRREDLAVRFLPTW